jgi:hypothetical protein
MRATTPFLLAVALLIPAACSSQPVESASTSASASAGSCGVAVCDPPQTTPSATPTTAPPAQVGQTVTSGGITLTVKDARAVDSILMNESHFRPGSGYEKYTKTAPKEGGRYVTVIAHVVNNAKVSLDLTCSLPVQTKLVDAQARYFDAIDDLYKIKGNPECNDQLQPGFETDMTWAYLVPKGAAVVGWGFRDTTDLYNAGHYSTVQFDA